MSVRLLFGLGNPGNRYILTRHNIGFLILDFIANQYKIPFQPGKGDYLFCHASIADTDVVLIKPTTYMNRSGLAVQQACDFFTEGIDQILLIYDDFNLDFGQLRFRKKGSAGGHNGIESVIYHLESDEIKRLRIGIGCEFTDSVGYVLSQFNEDEKEELPLLMKAAMEGITICVKDGIEKAMNHYNRNVLIDPNTN